MRFHTYTKYSPELADAVDLQSLLDKLANFLLDSGFAGGPQSHPFWGETGDEADRSLDGLKQAILDALLESGQFTPEMLEALRGDGDEDANAKLAELLDQLVQRLVSEGYLKILWTGLHRPCRSLLSSCGSSALLISSPLGSRNSYLFISGVSATRTTSVSY